MLSVFKKVFARLRARLLLIILLVLLPALLLFLYTASEQNRLASRLAQNEAFRLAQLSASNQEQLIRASEQLLLVLSQLRIIREGISPACDDLLVSLREQNPIYSNFFLVDTNGDTICTGIPNVEQVNASDRVWFQRGMTTGDFSMGDFAIGRVTGRPIVTFSYPILDETGEIRFLIGASLDLIWMEDFVNHAQLPPATTVTIVDSAGTVLYRYPDFDQWIGWSGADNIVIRAALDQKTGTIDEAGLDGVRHLYGFTRLHETEDSPFVIIGLPMGVVFAQANQLLVQNLFSLAVVGVVTVAAAWYGIDRFLMRQVDKLRTGTAQLAAGDLSARVELPLSEGGGELDELAHTFNTMAASLEQRQKELSHFNAELTNEIIERKRTEEALRRAREECEGVVEERTTELAFLVEASTLLASSLQYETTLDAVAKLSVPKMGDWCIVDMIEQGEIVKRVAIAHVSGDPAKSELMRKLEELYPSPVDSLYGFRHVIRTQKPQIIEEFTPEHLLEICQDEQHKELLDSLGLKSNLCVPLIARGRVLGAITFASSESGRIYIEDDLVLAEELARRIALAVDNALLYQEAHTQQEYLQVTLSSIGDAVIATDVEGRITFINPVAQGMTEWQDDEAIGLPLPQVFRIINEDSRQQVESPFDKVMREGNIVGLANHTLLISKSGQEIPIDDSGSPIQGQDGSIKGVILVFRDIGERRAAENALRESEERFRVMADTAPVLIWVSDADKQSIFFNKGWLEFTGRTLQEEMGHGWAENVHPDDYDRYLLTYHAAFDARQPFTIDYRLRRHDGEYRWVVDTAVPRFAPDSTFLGYIGSCIDITERRLSEERTRRLQRLTAALSEALTPEEAAEIIVNQGLSTIRGTVGTVCLITEDRQMLEIVNRGGLSDEIFEKHRLTPIDFPGPLTDAIRTGEIVWVEDFETYVRLYPHYEDVIRANGSQAIIALPLVVNKEVIGGITLSLPEPRRKTDDEIAFFLNLADQCAQAMERARLYRAEIMARTQAEAAQRRLAFLAEASAVLTASLDYQVTLNHLLELVVPRLAEWCHVDMLDADGRITRVAAAHTDPSKTALLYQLNRDHPFDLNAEMAGGKVIRTNQSEMIADFTESDIERYARNEEHLKALRVFDIGSSMIVPLTARGRTFGAVTFARSKAGQHFTPADLALAEELAHRAALAVDNAQLYNAEIQARQEAEKANELRLKFLGMVSHELRTPLASIKGFATTLLADDVTFDQESQHEFMSIINDEADHLTDLISQLLDLSSLQAGTLRIDPMVQDFRTIVDMALPSMERFTTGHKLILDIPDDLPPVWADARRITQVFANLVQNAAKFAPPETEVTIIARRRGSFIQVDVRDRGIGISEEARGYIFDPFRQAEDTQAPHKGAGLGLAVCKGLVESHGGQIWINDKGQSEGTTLSFTLPIHPGEAL